MSRRKKRLVGGVGLALMSLIAAGVGLCLGAVILMGLIRVYADA